MEKIEKLVAQASPEQEVLYLDPADVHLNPNIGATYLKPGQHPWCSRRANINRYIFGGLNARTARIVYGVAVRKNAEVFPQLLGFLNSRYRRARRIHLMLDN